MLNSLSESMSGPLAYTYKRASVFKPTLKRVMPTMPVAKGMVETTLAFTMAKGSEAGNVLPQEAYVIGDMRTSIHEGYQNSLKKVKEVASKFDIEVEVLEEAIESKMADYNCEGFINAAKAIKKCFGEDYKVAPYIMNQCSDSRFIDVVSDNCLRFVPFLITESQMNSIHGLNENVDINNLDKAVDFYKYMMKA